MKLDRQLINITENRRTNGNVSKSNVFKNNLYVTVPKNNIIDSA